MNDKIIRTSISVVMSAFLSVGCATSSNIPAYSFASGAPSSTRKAAAQATVLVDPFFDKEKTNEYFNVDAYSRGIAIVFVRVENHSQNTSFLVSKDSIRLRMYDESVAGTSGMQQNQTAGEAVMLTGAALLSLPLLFVGGGMITKAQRIQHNFAEKEIRTQSISPSEVLEGFVYFQFDKENPPGSMLLTVPVRNTTHGTTEEFNFNLTYAQ